MLLPVAKPWYVRYVLRNKVSGRNIDMFVFTNHDHEVIEHKNARNSG